jgi:plastocyanin
VSRRLLTLAFAAALLAGACGKIPQGTVNPGEGVRFIPYVADSLDNAGLGNRVTVDKDGVPYVSYLIFPAVVAADAIPIARPIGAPYITTAASEGTPAKEGVAIGIASLADNGIWTRGAAAQVRDTPAGIVVPYGPATEPSLIGATKDNTNGSDMAIDASGGFHVAWTGDDGVYYAAAPSTGGFTVDKLFKYGSTLDVAGPMSRPSVAVDSEGTPWVAYAVLSDRLEVDVATQDKDGNWVTTTVAESEACNGCPQPRAPSIGVTPDGPIVSWVDPASNAVMVARLKDGAWTTETVAPGVQAQGLDLAVDKDGGVFISFYGEGSATGAVTLVSTSGTGWTAAKVADAAPPASGSTDGNSEPTTGVAVDDNGKIYVTWYDGASDSVLLSTGDGSTFARVQTQDTQGAAYPSVAVKADGSTVYVAWYGEENEDLRLGVQGDAAALAVAVPSPTASVGAAPPPAECGKDGKVALDETAQGTAFLDACLVAPAGKDFSIAFDDKDDVNVVGQHNIVIASDAEGNNVVFNGDLVSGPAKVTYDVTKDSGPLDAGTYYFHCAIHPAMTGTLAVVKAK